MQTEKRLKVIITGGASLLGVNLALSQKGKWDVHLLVRNKLVNLPDVSTAKVSLDDQAELEHYMADLKPDFVIHAAAITDVDQAESNYHLSYMSNVKTTQTVAEACRKQGVKFVLVSTDHFSSEEPYSTEAQISIPVNNYAMTKLEAESVALKTYSEVLIVRTNFFGWGHKFKSSFSDRIINEARKEREIPVATDVYITPILIDELGRMIDLLVRKSSKGIFNVVGEERISKFEFAEKLLQAFGLDSTCLKPVLQKDFKNSAQRPRDMSLSNAKLKRTLETDILKLEDSFLLLKDQEFQGRRSVIHDSIVDVGPDKTIHYGKQSINDSDIDAVVNTLIGPYLTQGPKVNEFGDKVARLTGAKYGVAVSNWTTGLHIACLAIGLKEGDAIITSPLSFVASSNCAIYCGATPFFADIDPETLNISPESVERLCLTHRNVKAIIPVHFAGAPCDMESLCQIAEKYNLKIIEDAAHALGGKYLNGQPIGDGKYSDIVGFSFHPVKNVTSGEGAVITTNDDEIYKQLCRLRSHGITKGNDPFIYKELAFEKGEQHPWYYEMQQLGFNYRITDFQSALGISQLSRLEKLAARRVEIALRYDEAFHGLSNVRICQASTRKISGNHLYVVRVNFERLNMSRLELFKKFKEKNIGLHVHYIPIPLFPYYQKNFDIPESSYVEALSYYRDAVTLPLYPSMSDDEVKRVINAVCTVIG